VTYKWVNWPKNGLIDLKDESINKIAMVSCRSSFLWINGELLVGIYFGVLMESFLSIFGVEHLRILKIYR
jgi:hypothetical protein